MAVVVVMLIRNVRKWIAERAHVLSIWRLAVGQIFLMDQLPRYHLGARSSPDDHRLKLPRLLHASFDRSFSQLFVECEYWIVRSLLPVHSRAVVNIMLTFLRGIRHTIDDLAAALSCFSRGLPSLHATRHTTVSQGSLEKQMLVRVQSDVCDW